MRKVVILFYFAFVVLVLASCERDILDKKDNLNPDPIIVSSSLNSGDSALIKQVRDSLSTLDWIEITQNAGEPLWNCAYVQHLDHDISKVVIPWKALNYNDIENLLIAFKSATGNWRVKLVNKYYYLFLSNITEYEANRLVYEFILNEFDYAATVCGNVYTTSIHQDSTLSSRIKEAIATILWDDGSTWIIYNDGTISVSGGGGCGGGSSGTIIWTNGNSYTFSGNISTVPRPYNVLNWNPFENKGFNCSWCNQGGGGFSPLLSECNDPGYWANFDPQVKKEYINALSSLTNQFNINRCEDPNLTNEERNNCIDQEELLCLGLENDCINVVNGHLNLNEFTECFTSVIAMLPCNDFAYTFIVNHNLEMTPLELASQIGGFSGSCTSQEVFDNYLYEELGCNNITQSYLDDRQEIKTFVKTKTMESPGLAEEYAAFEASFTAMKCLYPDVKAKRAIELEKKIIADPFFLVADCILENEIDPLEYMDLYNFQPGSSTKSKIDLLHSSDNRWKLQPINTGNVAVTNLDYYPVEVTQLPDLDNDGSPETMDELWEAIKDDFTDIASGTKDNFNFSCPVPFSFPPYFPVANIGWNFLFYNSSEEQLWQSSNPLNTIFKIDASVSDEALNIIADDGSVIVSQVASCCFMVSSVESPFAGTQPYSGNRQWGFKQNSNGNVEIYTKAIDIARRAPSVSWIPLMEQCQTVTYYQIAHATWLSYQQKIKDFIDSHGGTAYIKPSKGAWINNKKIAELLRSDMPITSVPCD